MKRAHANWSRLLFTQTVMVALIVLPAVAKPRAVESQESENTSRLGAQLMADCLQLTGRAVVDASSREPAVSVCREAAVSAGESTVRASAYSSLAYSLLSLGRREEALAAAREAVRADGSSGNAHFIEAAALDELGRYGEAVGPHEEAIRLSPTSAGYRIRYAATLAKLDRWADALREGQEAQRMGSDDPYVKAAIETTMHEIEQGAHHRKWQRVIQDGRVIWRAP